MEAYFAFTDECGQYQENRSEKFLKTHPYYVRSTMIISWSDYFRLQKEMEITKNNFGLGTEIEIKWSHYGNAIKNNCDSNPHNLSSNQLEDYFSRILTFLSTLRSATIYYTLTDNNVVGKVNEIFLLRMHLQNALERVQMTVSDKKGFAVLIADDLNSKTKTLKKATYQLMLQGDYVKFTNVKKGIYIDFSNQCPGLQIADICAGVFTASLKHENVPDDEKKKFQYAYDFFFSNVYKKTRYIVNNTYRCKVYGIGVKEVPQGTGNNIAQNLSNQIERKLEEDLLLEVFS